ncbi:MAG: SDR family oxidoreductase [Planctomycetota bacterium]|nr:SDR family oxidoreductase [Planctomycetota bacterium]
MKDRIVLVTGAGRGIGKECALSFARAGAAGIVVASRNSTELQEVADTINQMGSRSMVLTLDISDETAVSEAPRKIESDLGPVDILVGSAGIAESAPLTKTPTTLWDRTIATNLSGPFFLTRSFLPGMLERNWGRVIHIASIAGKVGFPYVGAYCASKHGLLGLVKTAALEVAQKKVTVNALCPGYVDTPMTDRSISNISQQTGKSQEETRSFLEGQSPQKRLFTSKEIADAAIYLAGDSAAGINGQAISICGGTT